jgi:hypothetical protein
LNRGNKIIGETLVKTNKAILTAFQDHNLRPLVESYGPVPGQTGNCDRTISDLKHFIKFKNGWSMRLSHAGIFTIDPEGSEEQMMEGYDSLKQVGLLIKKVAHYK